jgi:hypothetical protein
MENGQILEEKEQNEDDSRVKLIQSDNNSLIIELNLSQPEIY